MWKPILRKAHPSSISATFPKRPTTNRTIPPALRKQINTRLRTMWSESTLNCRQISPDINSDWCDIWSQPKHQAIFMSVNPVVLVECVTTARMILADCLWNGQSSSEEKGLGRVQWRVMLTLGLFWRWAVRRGWVVVVRREGVRWCGNDWGWWGDRSCVRSGGGCADRWLPFHA